ncbi:MAG: hypothetical protein JXB39_04120 [Deltaproteobacteria bacterium]|nr:hypothetical protein [Deltaproteobacteria bacterium]
MLWTILVVLLACATDDETGSGDDGPGLEILSDGGTCDCPDKGPCSWTGDVHDGIPIVSVTFTDGAVRPAPNWTILPEGELKVDCGMDEGLTASVRWIP